MNKIYIITAVAFAAMSTGAFAQQTLVLQPGPDTGKDAFVWDYHPDNSFGDDDRLDVTAWTGGGVPYVSRIYFQFDLSSVPFSATINSAELSLYFNPTTENYNGMHSGANSSIIRRVTNAWEENTVTWNNQPSTTSLHQVNLPETTSGTQDFLDIDVTQLVSDIVNGDSQNFGFMMKLQVEEFYADLIFASSNHADTALHPKLVINYTETTDTKDPEAAPPVISFFPNPFSDKLLVNVKSDEYAKVVLYDISARILVEQQFFKSVTLNTEKLASGVYICEVIDNTGSVLSEKVVKQ